MFADFLELVFPNICVACEDALLKGEKNICIACMHKLPKTGFHLETDNDLCRKLWGRVPLTYGLAYLSFKKGNCVQSILHHIKYKEAKSAATMLGHWYGEELAEAGFCDKFDLIVPVPLHKKKLKKRGYNQSSCFGIGLAERLSVTFSETTLVRTKERSTQTNKDRVERWTNVHDLYQVRDQQDLSNKRVLLVDDVATTGATIEVCANQLLMAGAAEISIAVIAMAY